MGIELHNELIEKNHNLWNRKPILRKVYTDLYRAMSGYLNSVPGRIVELGSGMGSIHEIIPECVRTDLFPYPWIDQIENAYHLSFANNSISNLLMTDVFHHLRYPGTALNEFHRVLAPGGRVIIMEPGMGLLGRLVYGVFHAEPVAFDKEITWFAPDGWRGDDPDYYAAQGNAARIFIQGRYADKLTGWKTIAMKQIAALAYAASGGYSGPQLYPTVMHPIVKLIEKTLQFFPALFATRLLVVLEKTP
jgi:SAM-dependent methyltransferase